MADLPSTLLTSRLLLRAPERSDAVALFKAYTTDPEVSRYMVWRPHASLAQTEAFIGECIRAWQDKVRHPYIVTRSGEAVGMLEARLQDTLVDIGYVLRRSEWGQGLMPEAVNALAQACLSQPCIYRVQAVCDVDNQASARTLEKAGFAREGRLERCLIHPNVSAEPRACYLYARCRSA